MIWSWSLAAMAANPLPVGTYVFEVDVATETKLPFVGWSRVVTRTRAIAEVEEEDGALFLSQQPCAISVEGGGPGRTTIPWAFVNAFPVQRFPLELVDGAEGWTLSADPGPVCVGCAGALPSDAAGAVDWERDGRPGATVEVHVPVFGAVDMYVAQRSHVRYEGTVRDGVVTGSLDFRVLEQTTLGASVPAFAVSPRVNPVAEASGFRLTPVGADASCAQLASR